MTDIRSDIISTLAEFGQDGCSVNKLFIKCGKYSKNDFIKTKNELRKHGIIREKNEGRQKLRLSLDPAYLIELDRSFKYNLRIYQGHANDALKQLQRLKPLFEHKDSKSHEIQVASQKIAILLRQIIDSLEAIAHHIMAFTFRYHIDQNVRKSDLIEHQKYGFEIIQKIIEKLISQHKDEEKEIRNYLLWGTSSSFSYVVG